MASILLMDAVSIMKLSITTPLRAVLGGLALALFAVPLLRAEEAAPAAPTTDERVAALEAYVNNGDPGKSLTGVPGPGHNAWMMTSAALVLFMTLPGLALFYGGLVRRKNVLSVLAQCLGITGLVSILWKGLFKKSSAPASMARSFSCSRASTPLPTPTMRTGCRRTFFRCTR